MAELRRSASLSATFNSHSSAYTQLHHPFASTTSSSFISSPRSLRKLTSPTRVNTRKYTSPSASFFTPDRSGSANRSISVSATATSQKRTCMCSPTNHPGSFRCSLHKAGSYANRKISPSGPETVSCGSPRSRLNMRRSAMTNSLVWIGTVEGDLMRRALAALIRPSSHQQRRRGEFRPLPSRLSTMSMA